MLEVNSLQATTTGRWQVTQRELLSQKVGPLPIVNHFLARLGLDDALESYVPQDDERLRLAPAAVLSLVVTNLVVDHEPVYRLSEWAGPYDPGLLGLAAGEAALLNDDRVGRMLDRLFDSDRASLLTEVMVRAIRRFRIDTDQLHNDSTTVTFAGAHKSADGRARGGKQTAAICFGYNKDHRPDLKQLVFVLTVSSDGAVPIAHRVLAGNTEDSTTHIESWDDLCGLVGKRDFLYVCDSKLATREAMDHIAAGGGRFVTVLPRTRREDGWFRDFVTRNTPTWTEALRRPARRRDDRDDVLSTFEPPLGSAEGYRIIWVHSSNKKENDAATRERRIERANAALEELGARLSGPKSRIKTRVAAEQAAAEALELCDAWKYFEVTATEVIDKDYRAEHRGKPGSGTRFRQLVRKRVTLAWKLRPHVVRDEAASDGMFPLVTNDAAMTAAEVLVAYKYQPNLERRNHCLKDAQHVAPMNLHTAARIEALLCCHFFALVTSALIERQVRSAMAKAEIKTIPIYPEGRSCTSPSAQRVLELFEHLDSHVLVEDGVVVEIFEPNLSPLQRQLLKLLGVPLSAYGNR